MLVRMLLYNSWKINLVYLGKCQKEAFKTQTWTLQDNQDAMEEIFLKTYNKLHILTHKGENNIRLGKQKIF